MHSPRTSRKLETLLNLSKGAALIITAIATIYGFTHSSTEIDAQGNRHPTASLKLSIGFVAFGLFFGLNAMVLEVLVKRQTEQREEQERRETELAAAQEKQQAALEAAAKERRQTLRELRATQEIILAAQPLVSLQIKWAFEDLPEDLLASIAKADIENPEEANRKQLEQVIDNYTSVPSTVEAVAHWIRYDVVYPFMNVLASGKWSPVTPILAVLYLNSSRASVLPLGCLQFSEELAGVAAGVDFVDDVDEPLSYGRKSRKRNADFVAEHEQGDSRFILKWQFASGELDQAIDNAIPTLRPSAWFPEVIELALFSSIENLPFQADNFAKPEEPLPESGIVDPDSPMFLKTSTLQLWPNEIPNFKFQYRMNYEGRQRFAADSVRMIEGAYFPFTKSFCNLSLWRGIRISREEGGDDFPDREPLLKRLKNIDWGVPDYVREE